VHSPLCRHPGQNIAALPPRPHHPANQPPTGFRRSNVVLKILQGKCRNLAQEVSGGAIFLILTLGLNSFGIVVEIGATARQFGLTVITHDIKHFSEMPGV